MLRVYTATCVVAGFRVLQVPRTFSMNQWNPVNNNIPLAMKLYICYKLRKIYSVETENHLSKS